jgi:hypothetical protein
LVAAGFLAGTDFLTGFAAGFLAAGAVLEGFAAGFPFPLGEADFGEVFFAAIT